LIADISARGKLPVLAGGTMLYFKALFDGLDDMPAAHPELRAAIEAEAAQRGWPALHAELAAIDPITAARLAPADSQRIQRALEVFRVSGKPLSYFHSAQSAIKSEAAGAISTGASTLISLEPTDRAWLHARIAQRFDAMLELGLLDEVRNLRARGDLHRDLPSMRCVGYRQAWEALDGDWPLAELRERGLAATRQLCKRQITWLRSMPERQIIACDQAGAQDRVLALAERLMAVHAHPAR
jgi:tRNA dimethylallyltransferase